MFEKTNNPYLPKGDILTPTGNIGIPGPPGYMGSKPNNTIDKRCDEFCVHLFTQLLNEFSENEINYILRNVKNSIINHRAERLTELNLKIDELNIANQDLHNL